MIAARWTGQSPLLKQLCPTGPCGCRRAFFVGLLPQARFGTANSRNWGRSEGYGLPSWKECSFDSADNASTAPYCRVLNYNFVYVRRNCFHLSILLLSLPRAGRTRCCVPHSPFTSTCLPLSSLPPCLLRIHCPNLQYHLHFFYHHHHNNYLHHSSTSDSYPATNYWHYKQACVPSVEN